MVGIYSKDTVWWVYILRILCGGYILYFFNYLLRLLLLSAGRRCGVYSRASLISILPIPCDRACDITCQCEVA